MWDVRRDTFDLGPAGLLTREYVDHPGAVCVLALDDAGAILLIEQYRHPIGSYEWEIPAGLLDVAGESPVECARRELFEEADLRAATWHLLADFMASPGALSEPLRIFLARDVTPVPEAERHTREGEELGMPARWVPLEDAHEAVLDGRLHNPALVIAVHTAMTLRARNWRGLRPANAAWPEHPAYR